MNKEEMKEEAALSTEIAEETPDRRTFMKGTLMLATAAVAGGLNISVSGAEPLQEGAIKSRANKLVFARFTKKPPTLDDIQSLVAQIVGRAGCTACGLLGIDLRLGVDPAVKLGRGVQKWDVNSNVDVVVTQERWRA